MKKIMPKSAGVLIAISFYILLHILYAVLGTVDLIYVKDGEIIARQDNVCTVSIIDDPIANMDEATKAENENVVFVYDSFFSSENEFGKDMFALRAQIGFTVIFNLITFRWSDTSNQIVFYAQ